MITVRVVSAPITLMRWKTEEDFGQTAATVSFICLKLLFYIYRLSLQWILAIGCFISFLPTFWFGWHAYWLRASVQKAFMTIRLAFCGLICCLRVGAFFYFCVCSVFLVFFLICLSGFSSELELLSITPFSHPDVSFPPCFPLCYSPCFCNASWEPGNGVRCRGWGKPHPPHHVLPFALDLKRPCSAHHSLILSASTRGNTSLFKATRSCSVLHDIL